MHPILISIQLEFIYCNLIETVVHTVIRKKLSWKSVYDQIPEKELHNNFVQDFPWKYHPWISLWVNLQDIFAKNNKKMKVTGRISESLGTIFIQNTWLELQFTRFLLWCYWFNSLKTCQELLSTAFIFVGMTYFRDVEQLAASVEGAFWRGSL